MPETYWILATVYGYRFVLDLQEGERVGLLLDAYQEGADRDHQQFLRFADYTGATARCNYAHITACYLSTPDSRAFDDAVATNRQKRSWGDASEE